MLFFIARAPFQEHVVAQAAVLLIGFVAHTLVSPVALIGLTLVYFDQRVRMEAFDLVMMLGGSVMEPAAEWALFGGDCDGVAGGCGGGSGCGGGPVAAEGPVAEAEPVGSDGQV